MARNLLAITLLFAIACGEDPPPLEPEDQPTPPIHTPRWAFSPWISKDISTGEDTYAFVAGFEARNIPVGVVVLDSPWETSYNTFVPNPSRYPNFAQLVAELRARNIRTVLWVTPLINEESFDVETGGDTYEGPASNFNAALREGYLVNGGALYFWWKGKGGALDFYNPAAIRWWHRQQDPLLELGVAGWKLDFGESYINTPTIETAAGTVEHQRYSEAYYEDFYKYGVLTRGRDEFLTMVRAYDKSYQFEGRFFAKKEHAPVTWMGDNRRDWIGLSDALDHMFRSAAAGYVVVGSDVGGYLDHDDKDSIGPQIPFDVEVLAKWIALGALNPFMQLHGRANITPWTVPERADEIVALYRYWATLHEELVPYLYALSEEAYAGREPPLLRPIASDPAAWAGDYRFMLGPAFLVAPLLAAGGVREVALPAGDRWYDWWDEAGSPLEGGQTVTASLARELGRIPLYVKEGAIVPLTSRSELTGLGVGAELFTLALWPSSREPASFTLHEGDTLQVVRVEPVAQGYQVTLPALSRPLLVRVRHDQDSNRARLDGAVVSTVATQSVLATSDGLFHDPNKRLLWVRVGPSEAPRTLLIDHD